MRALILLVLLVLTGCQSNQNKTVSTLKIDFQEGDLPSLHPHALMIYLRGISTAKTLYECLTRIDEQGRPQLAGAQSVDISSDKMRYTCTIGLDAVGIKVLNDKTLLVELAYPSPYFLELAAQPICAPLVSPQNKDSTLFNGPFLVDEWKHNDYLRLKPNPYYWDKEHISLRQIEITMVQDMMTTYSMYEKKQLDWVGVPLNPLSSELIGHLEKQGTLLSHPVDRAFWVFLNTQHPSLSSSAIRRALSLAIDRPAITQHILIGGHPLDKPLPSALLPNTTPNMLRKDLPEAQKLFAQGLADLGFTKQNFPPLVITYSQQANRKQLAEYLQQAWSQAFGIPVRVEAQEWNVLRCNLEKGDYVISGCFEAAFYKDPMEILEKLSALTNNNFAKWTSPAFQAIVASAKTESNPQKRMELLSKAEQILMEEMPFI
ncbi:MAG: peptide ABC transporter substrate-binding protein, partial [Candidatus Melainabacteria bacterium]|nr:peptide ABC transporter substrate-binding protein [Candidatus Melainabacteria bacterium]